MDMTQTTPSQLSEGCEDEFEVISELIRNVEIRRFIYDVEDNRHKDRNQMSAAWIVVAQTIGKDEKWCRAKWKQLRDYYMKIKRKLKGKSGQARSTCKPWVYFKAMSFLEYCVDENEQTLSNMDNQTREETGDNFFMQDDVELPRSASSLSPETIQHRVDTRKQPTTKRRLDSTLEDVNQKIMKYLDDNQEVQDSHHHFGMMVADKLRKLPQQASSYVQMECMKILYEVEYNESMLAGNHPHCHSEAVVVEPGSPEDYNDYRNFN